MSPNGRGGGEIGIWNLLKSQFGSSNGLKILSPNGWGDWDLELTQIYIWVIQKFGDPESKRLKAKNWDLELALISIWVIQQFKDPESIWLA